jgi:hypothetical protein
MSLYKHEIMGSVHALKRMALQAQKAIVEGWEEQDTMLTPRQVDEADHALSEAKRIISAAQKEFAKFEAVADARKITSTNV